MLSVHLAKPLSDAAKRRSRGKKHGFQELV